MKVPYQMPRLCVRFVQVQSGHPVEQQLTFEVPIFYPAFFTNLRLQSANRFRQTWDAAKYSGQHVASDIFIGRFDLVKDEARLQLLFPGMLFLAQQDFPGVAHTKKDSYSFRVPFFQYGLALHRAGANYWLRLNVDITNAIFIETCVPAQEASMPEVEFLINHIISILSD